MTVSLGLDIGSNSVGSAWVDTEARIVEMAVSVFPAGVEESEAKRGNPVNQKRRAKRQQRRSLARRSRRKRRLLKVLVSAGLLPADREQQQSLWELNPWHLRRKGLAERLSRHEFGRILVHLNQRRGALGLKNESSENGGEDEGDTETNQDDAASDDRKVLAGLSRLRCEIKARNARTFGEFMAQLYDERQSRLPGQSADKNPVCSAIRNRRDSFEFHADRALIHEEFQQLWQAQLKFGGELADLLTEKLCRQLDDPTKDKTWRQKGALFGQRQTYWDTGTLGRCDLEPTDHRCPWMDCHAQEFRVLETINNLRLQHRGGPWDKLNTEQRQKVLAALRRQKGGSIATLRNALGINKREIKAFWRLNAETDADREINTDWFYRSVVLGVFGESAWNGFLDKQRESVNRALQKFDPESDADTAKLRAGAQNWWSLSDAAAERLLEVWRRRPPLEKRIKLSRHALLNLLPYLREGLTVTEARQRFSADPSSAATPEQRRRYALNAPRSTKADRHYVSKHGVLPPAPMLSNPVVRKAIHEVRRHVIAWMRKFGRKPDHIVIEMARSAKQPAKQRNELLALNRRRQKIRERILEDFKDYRHAARMTANQERAAVERVLLCKQQRLICPYSKRESENSASLGKAITLRQAFEGSEVEIDHIVAYSRCGDNSLNNKLLCYRKSNRNKSNQTLRECLPHDAFKEVETRLAFMENANPQNTDYFTKRDYAKKWENIHREARADDEWRGSQLSDTAYAAREVAAYLADALYGGQPNADGINSDAANPASDANRAGEHADRQTRKIFFTMGSNTAILRRDWQLFQRIRSKGYAETTEDSQASEKNRGDHRHHAIDAMVIAMTDGQRLQRLATLAREQEEARSRSDRWPRREPVEPPWGTIREFRRQVLGQVFATFQGVANDGETWKGDEHGKVLVTCHRVIKRRLIGAFHKEDCWGEVNGQPDVYRIRCPIVDLTTKMLRMPMLETDDELRKRLASEYITAGMRPGEARKKAKAMVARGGLHRHLVEPSLGKGGLVRDWNLRAIIREWLKANSIDPDDFLPKEIKDLALQKQLAMPSGVPIRSVITIGPISDAVKIPVCDPATGKQAFNQRTGRPLFRYYFSRNNHHVEIREDAKTGKWKGKCVTMFDAVQRVRPPKKDDGTRSLSQAAVDKSDDEQSRFVMSLAMGETIHACRNDRPNATSDYFVVVKLDGTRIWFAHHWDARMESGKTPEEKQDRWDITYADLKACGPLPGTEPYKVVMCPACEPRRVDRD